MIHTRDASFVIIILTLSVVEAKPIPFGSKGKPACEEKYEDVSDRLNQTTHIWCNPCRTAIAVFIEGKKMPKDKSQRAFYKELVDDIHHLSRRAEKFTYETHKKYTTHEFITLSPGDLRKDNTGLKMEEILPESLKNASFVCHYLDRLQSFYLPLALMHLEAIELDLCRLRENWITKHLMDERLQNLIVDLQQILCKIHLFLAQGNSCLATDAFPAEPRQELRKPTFTYHMLALQQMESMLTKTKYVSNYVKHHYHEFSEEEASCFGDSTSIAEE